MPATITVLEAADRQLAALARTAGLLVNATLPLTDLLTIDRQAGRMPDVLLLDLREHPTLPPDLGSFKRRHPQVGLVIVASQLDPALMLDAMRAGVTECVTEPVTAADLKTAVENVIGAASPLAPPGQVLAFMGAKGGVGTTTLVVNVAAALAAEQPSQVLVVDLHLTGHGDAALFLGVEPRFSIVDALENVRRLDEAFLRGLVVRAKTGPDVLASPERPLLRHPDGQQVRALLERLASHYRCIVLDVPRSDLGTLDALERISTMTLVINQELATVRRAAQIAALLRQRYGKDRVATVVTRYDTRADIGQEDIERVVGLPVWGVMPSDYRQAVAAANVGRPLVVDNHSRLAGSVRNLAHRLAGVPIEGARPGKPSKPSGRLGKFF